MDGGEATGTGWEYWIALEAAVPAGLTGVSLTPDDYPELGELSDRYVALCRFEVTVNKETDVFHVAFALSRVV